MPKSESGFIAVDPIECAPTFAIHAEDGRELLVIQQDGTVTGAVEDATEAGARFVEYLRTHLAPS